MESNIPIKGGEELILLVFLNTGTNSDLLELKLHIKILEDSNSLGKSFLFQPLGICVHMPAWPAIQLFFHILGCILMVVSFSVQVALLVILIENKHHPDVLVKKDILIMDLFVRLRKLE